MHISLPCRRQAPRPNRQLTFWMTFILSQIAPVVSSANPLPPVAPDRGSPISVRVSAKQGEDQPFFLAVFGDIPTAEEDNAAHIANLHEAIKVVSVHTSSEEGCKLFECYVDVDAPKERIVLLESWRDVAAIKAHVGKPHMKPWREALGAAKVKAGFHVGIPLY
jgi:quinol monooxygenase YgiN